MPLSELYLYAHLHYKVFKPRNRVMNRVGQTLITTKQTLQSSNYRQKQLKQF